ncbi:MAG: SCP2 sterol-binding domain-containing protein [Anaerolineae bacterium]|nr:SCP2 sterol-binding domain-containing protein [Anaerolineae bacterium]
MSVADDVQEIFAKMPAAFLPDKAAGLNKTILIDLNGEGGGQWALKIADGQISVSEGQIDSPNLALRMAASDYVALVNGQANPMNLFMAGKIKVEGDVMLAMKFQEMFERG